MTLLFKYICIFSLGGTFRVIVMFLIQVGTQVDSKMEKITKIILYNYLSLWRFNIKQKSYLNKKTCKFLNIDNNTLDKWIKQYNFPCIKIDRVIRFEIEDIKEFMNMLKCFSLTSVYN